MKIGNVELRKSIELSKFKMKIKSIKEKITEIIVNDKTFIQLLNILCFIQTNVNNPKNELSPS